ncbi:MAG: hypothetical protein MI755_03580 [Sphingomonadales bacterium]|nr:hypothetical protein [Sphingomonadales bacterium]
MGYESSKALTAAQEILFGAVDLDAEGKAEFSEWDLTVATWKRNPNRFGCRGYEAQYPDHKRVMMEIMGTTKKENPIRRGWLEKVRQNTYSLTNLGRTEAERLSQKGKTGGESRRSPQAVYDAVAPLYRSSVFRKHSKYKDEPRMWLGAASFLQLTSSDPQHLRDRMIATEKAIENAIAWMDENETSVIRRGVSGSGEAISRENLNQLQDFYATIKDRFADQIEAITKRLK